MNCQFYHPCDEIKEIIEFGITAVVEDSVLSWNMATYAYDSPVM